MFFLRAAMAITMFVTGGCAKTEPLTPKADTPATKRLRIAAAADLRFVLPAVKVAFEKSHAGTTLDLTFGASGTLLAQIENGAPFDIFLSADEQYAQKLIDAGKAVSEKPFPYARGHLVMWVPNSSKLELTEPGLKVLEDPSIQHVSLANPQHAPYGQAAIAALRYYQLEEALQEKLVFGENVAQAAQYVQSGAAQVGLIAKSLAMSEEMMKTGWFVDVPLDAYPPLIQAGVIIKSKGDIEIAGEFEAYLTSAEARAELAKFGFASPEER
ncbi:molybdate ABC transporter substrate-binding protein [Lacunimicrobium album]